LIGATSRSRSSHGRFDSLEELQRALAPTNVALLRTIVRESPASIRETARLVERDVKDVHRNLNELARLGLIEFDDDGHAKQPTVWYDHLQVDLDFADDRTAVERLGAALDTT
jgi:predicted transcriptional regulator